MHYATWLRAGWLGCCGIRGLSPPRLRPRQAAGSDNPAPRNLVPNDDIAIVPFRTCAAKYWLNMHLEPDAPALDEATVLKGEA